jgi:hypothetical protein
LLLLAHPVLELRGARRNFRRVLLCRGLRCLRGLLRCLLGVPFLLADPVVENLFASADGVVGQQEARHLDPRR